MTEVETVTGNETETGIEIAIVTGNATERETAIRIGTAIEMTAVKSLQHL